MLSRRAIAGAAALLLLLAGCSDPQGTEPGDAAGTATEEGAAAGESPGEGGGSSATKGDESGGGKGGSGGKSAQGDSGRGKSGGGGGRPGSGGGGGGSGFAGGSGGSAGYPAAGEYVYAQEGFERFCQGPSCSKEPLPDTATITSSITSRSSSGATVVSESRSSDRQTVTTTTRYTPDAALITNVVIDFAYGSFNFSQSYEPRPPVVSLSFPLEDGKTWRGRWKAQTSGDYRMKVVGSNGTIYEIDTVTNFKGDFSGRAQATIWVDAKTGVVTKTDGQIAVASGFGEYMSSFVTTLRSGPGY